MDILPGQNISQSPAQSNYRFRSLHHRAAPFKYRTDGSGRDSYISCNDGGLRLNSKPLSNYHLSNFLRDKKYISDYDWMYFPDLFNENERMNIAKICLLYQLVNEYSIKNSISVNDCEYGNYYSVKYKSFSFDIGVKLDKGIMFFCSQNIYDDNYIDFNNILKKKEKILIKK